MKITKKSLPDQTDTFICIDLEGLDIGIPITDIYFNIKTYDKLKRAPIPQFELWMKPINIYFNSIPDNEKKEIALMYYNIKNKLYEIANKPIVSEDVFGTLDKIGFEANEVFKRIGTIEKLKNIVLNDEISIPDFKDKVLRPQDKVELTFQYDEYIELTIISIICKIFCPVFSEIIHVFFKKDVEGTVDKFLKERYSMGVIRYIIFDNFIVVIDKLNGYIANEVNKIKDFQFGSVFHGYTKINLTNFITGALFVKKFVNVNLYKKDGDIMVFIMACIKWTTGSILAGIRGKKSVKERYTPSDTPSMYNDDDGNKSNIEVEIKEYDTTIDIPIIVKVGVNKLIDEKIREYEININEFNEAVNFYLKSTLPPTPINTFLLCIYFSKEIGGANGIQMLTAEIYYRCIVFLQLYFIKNDLLSLVEGISVIPLDTVKEELSREEHIIRIERGTGLHYQLCQEKFTLLDSSHIWNDFLHKTICDFITLRNNLTNTAPGINKLINVENNNGKIYKPSEKIMEDIYKFISKIII